MSPIGLDWIGLGSVVFYSIGVSFDRFDWIAAMGVFGIAKTRQDLINRTCARLERVGSIELVASFSCLTKLELT